MTNAQFRYWEDGKQILIEADNWDCFLENRALNPMINWLNLHKDEIEQGKPCSWADKDNSIVYCSVAGHLTIKTNRDVVFLNSEQLKEFIEWLNKKGEVLNIREVWL